MHSDYENRKLGIYIHIPFCRSKCAYCDFNSTVIDDYDAVHRYIDALIAHMESYRQAADEYLVDTVFIGGGTPTSINPDELYRLIRAVRHTFNVSKNTEFTVEANPATVTYPGLVRLHRLGVNRISFGLQTADNNELKALSRIHTRHDFLESFEMAREARFDNINVDLMFGIPYQTEESLYRTIRWLAKRSPDHISLYNLKVEPETPFGRHYMQLAPTLADEDTQADMYLGAISLLRQYGYIQYEISNFARPGHMCAHNLKYWNCDEYLGFGVSAHSFFNGSRFSFIRDREKYVKGILEDDANVKITDECEQISDRERAGEYVMLRLRLNAGIDDREYFRRFGNSFKTLYGAKCRKFIENGFMNVRNGVYSLTPRGMFVSNYILSDILEFEDFGKYGFGVQ